MRELVVILMGGCRYGVWKDAVLSSRRIHGIHWLPLSPECLSGVAEFDGRTATLFDLSVCLGHGPFDRRLPGEAIILTEDPRPGGFVYAEESDTVEVDPEELLPMPGFLNSEEFEGCAVCSGEPVVVIGISLLYRRAMGPEWKPAGSLPAVAAPPLEPSEMGEVRLFEASGERFAVPAQAVEEEAAKPGPIRPLPLAPPYVEGLCLHEGRTRAVISFARRMGLEDENRGVLLFPREGDFAILAGSDLGMVGLASGPLPMPPLSRRDSTPLAVAIDGEIIPLIHVPALIGRDGEADLRGAYTPRSKFAALFGKRQVKVCEFSASGMTLVVPDSQVETVTGFRAMRRMENLHPMMRGIALHDGKVLPVLDLALCFGRHTGAGQASKMIYLRNGSFEALLLAETVFERRTVPVPEQHELPLNLPHQYVYGCYTDENEVRLILNVEALAVHFDRDLVSEYFETIARQTDSPIADISRADISRRFAGADFERKRHTSGEAAEEAAVSPVYSTAGDEIETTGTPVTARTTRQENAGAPSPEAPDAAEGVAESDAGESGAREEGEGGPAPLAPADASSAEAPEKQESRRNPDGKPPLNEKQRIPGSTGGSGAEATTSGEGEGGKALAGLPPAESDSGGMPQETRETEGHEIGGADGNALHGDGESEPVPDGDRDKPPLSPVQAQTGPQAPGTIKETSPVGVERGPLSPPAPGEKESISIGLTGFTGADAVHREQHASRTPGKRGRRPSLRWAVYALVILASMLASYLAFMLAPDSDGMREAVKQQRRGDTATQSPDLPGEGELRDAEARGVEMEKSHPRGKATSEGTAKAGTAAWQAAAGSPVAEVEHKARKGNASSRGTDASASYEGRNPLGEEEEEARSGGESPSVSGTRTGKDEGGDIPVLVIRPVRSAQDSPRMSPVAPSDESGLYEVKNGDTLWHIAGRFTGDPFNYPHIAHENSIPNPDLIFPGQLFMVRVIYGGEEGEGAD